MDGAGEVVEDLVSGSPSTSQCVGWERMTSIPSGPPFSSLSDPSFPPAKCRVRRTDARPHRREHDELALKVKRREPLTPREGPENTNVGTPRRTGYLTLRGYLCVETTKSDDFGLPTSNAFVLVCPM